MQDECEFVQVRLRGEEKRRWREMAKRLDLSVAQLVRRAVRAYATKCRESGEADNEGEADEASR